jgi:hypothetical protein
MMIATLDSALPANFDFYHLGTVEKARSALTDSPLTLEGRHNVVISLQGESRALVVTLFDESLDHSTYTELANIVASRLATSLETGISAPKTFTNEVLSHLLAGRDLSRFQYYHHAESGPVIPIEVLILPLPTETADV